MSRSPIPTRRSKYGVRLDAEGKRARTVDGIVFASLKEAHRYGELLMLVKAGDVRTLRLQPRFGLTVDNGDYPDNGHGRSIPLGVYRADFAYEQRYCVTRDGIRHELWRGVVEDVKGFDTPLSKWKRRHCEAQYGVQIALVR